MTAGVTVTSITMGAFTGTLDTNGQTVTLSSTFSVTGTATRTLTLGSSTINCTTMVLTSTTNLTFNAGTSTINAAASSITFGTGVGLAFANVTISPTANATINGSNTFSSLTLTGPASKAVSFSLAGNQTVSGTFTANGNSATNRIIIQSSVKGTARTITAATWTITNADFQDITGAGAGSRDLSAITGGSGDCGGNSGITFTTPATQYWQHGASASYNWSDSTRWFLATNGGGGAGRVPLPQDSARFDANSFAAGSKTVVQDMPRIPSTDWTGVTNTPTWTTSTAASFFGSITLVSGMTLTASTQTYTYEGRGSSTLTSAGKTWGKAFAFDAPGGTLTLGDALSASSITMSNGTVDANDFNVTIGFLTVGSGTKTITMGSGTWTLNAPSTNLWTVGAGTTVNAETSTIRLASAMAAGLYFSGNGLTYYNLEIATTGAFAINFQSSNTFNNIHIDASAAARTVLFTAGTTTTVASMTRDAGTNVITIGSITAASHTLTKSGGGTITVENMSVSRSTAGPGGSVWYANFSTDGGNNTNWNFTRIHQATSTVSGSATLDVLAAYIHQAVLSVSGPVALAFVPSMTLAGESTISGSVTLSPNGGLILGMSATIRGSVHLGLDWSDVPTGRFSAALKDALASGRAMAIWLLEMEIAGTTHRVGYAPYSSRSGNHYSAGLLSLALGSESLSDRESRVSPWEARGELEDVDRTIAGLLAGASGDDVIGGAARVWLAHPDVLPAHWFKAREGFIARLAPSGALRYAIDFRPNDGPLRTEPLPSWTITRSTWPNTHDSAIGNSPVIPYGTHDGANLGVTRGLLPAHLVDTATHAFVLSRGWSKTITRVCGDDAEISPSDYTITRPLIKGRRYTLCTFDDGTHDEQSITWDGEGLEDAGDGTGALIESPLRQLAHALSNFYFADSTGDWLATAAEIDADCLDEASDFLDARGVAGSLAITEKETGEALIARVLASNEARAVWNNEGAICFQVDETDADPYASEVVDWRADDLGEMSITEQDVAVVARLTVEHALDKAANTPLSTFEIQLPKNDGMEAETLDLTTSDAQ